MSEESLRKALADVTAERDALKAELRHAEGVVYYCNDGDDERLTALCRRLRAALGEKA